MVDIRFGRGALTPSEQAIVSEGFLAHSGEQGAPEHTKEKIKWLGIDDRGDIRAVLTADILWDWMYVDELWVCPTLRRAGLGRRLMLAAEEFAIAESLQGLWLWTQSWQAENFYLELGYRPFTRFSNFPKGHSRIGLRKQIA